MPFLYVPVNGMTSGTTMSMRMEYQRWTPAVRRTQRLYSMYPGLLASENRMRVTRRRTETVVDRGGINRFSKRSRLQFRVKSRKAIFESALDKLERALGTQIQQYSPNPLAVSGSRASVLAAELFDWATMPISADVVGGGLPPERAPRKRQQLTNLLIFATPFLFDGCVVCDFASGCGHQTIPLAVQFPKCTFVLIDMKAQCIATAERRCSDLGLTNVRCIVGKIEDFEEPFDVGLSLHACGVASDLAQNLCLRHRAVYINCPCCVGKVVNWRANDIKYPRSLLIQNILSKTEYEQLARAGDFGHDGYDSSVKDERRLLRRRAKTMVEIDRNLYAHEQLAYKTWLFMLHPTTCTPKNDLVVGCIKKSDVARFEQFLQD